MNKFNITIDGKDYDVTVNVTDHNKAHVEVNGLAYDVKYESKNLPTSPLTRKAKAPEASPAPIPAAQTVPPEASALIPHPDPLPAQALHIPSCRTRPEAHFQTEPPVPQGNRQLQKENRTASISRSVPHIRQAAHSSCRISDRISGSHFEEPSFKNPFSLNFPETDFFVSGVTRPRFSPPIPSYYILCGI